MGGRPKVFRGCSPSAARKGQLLREDGVGALAGAFVARVSKVGDDIELGRIHSPFEVRGVAAQWDVPLVQ